MFQIGQKVVCIDATVRADCVQHLPLRPKLNGVYTVSSIHTEPNLEGYGIRLEELPNPSFIWSSGEDKEWSFDARKFRPLSSVEHQNDTPAYSGGKAGGE